MYISFKSNDFCGWATSRRWGRAGPSRRRLAQPAPGPAGDIFKITGPTKPDQVCEIPIPRDVGPAPPASFQSHCHLPGLAREILGILSLFLRAVSPPPRGFEAATCSLARAPRLFGGVARTLQSAYEAESAMPL